MHRSPVSRSAGLFLLLIAPLLAPGHSAAAELQSGFYGFVDYAWRTRPDNNQRPGTSDGATYGFGAGWYQANGLSLELQHVPEVFEQVITIEYVNTGVGAGTIVSRSKYGAKTTALMLGWTIPFSSTAWSATIQAGVHKPDFHFPEPDAVGPPEDLRLAAGMRLSYAATQHWSISAAYARYDMKRFSDFDRVGLRLDYQF